MHGLRIKRVYDAPATSDGVRVLVDRLWPRWRDFSMTSKALPGIASPG
jgi:uncharacterized protein YeaO (DUF488 family)